MSQSNEEKQRILGNIRFLLMHNPVRPEYIPSFVEAISWLEKQLPKAEPKKDEESAE